MKANFVYNYLTPQGPVSNVYPPLLEELAVEGATAMGHDGRRPNFYRRFRPDQIALTHIEFGRIPDRAIYELKFPIASTRGIVDQFTIGSGLLDHYPHSRHILGHIGRGDGYILIPVEGETYMPGELFDAMHAYFNHWAIPLRQVIYMTNAPNADVIYQQYVDQQAWPRNDRMKLHYANPFLIRDYRQHFDGDLAVQYQPGPRSHTFLSFNYAHHDHRMIFIAMCHQHALLDHSYFSMPLFDYADRLRHQLASEIHRHADTRLRLNITDTLIDATAELLPLVVDEEFTRATQDRSQASVDLYANSLVSVISETNFYGIGRKRALDNPAVHVTEKTFKAITWLHPFVMLSSAGTLAHLRALGFKTFGQWWDEGYDSMANANDRMLAVVNVMRSIQAWPPAQRVEFTHEVKAIVDYNYAHLRSMPDVGVDEFVGRFGV